MTDPTTPARLTRRGTLLGLTAAVTLGRSSLALAAAETEKRFVVIILRGAMDGLSAVVPYGDPMLTRWRPELLPAGAGQPGGMMDLGGFYGLHPALPGLHAMYVQGQLLILHAVAGPYRSRSHFEAQDYLESGAEQRMTSGWLNRAIAAMPGGGASEGAVAIGVTVPLLLRGPANVSTYAPESFAPLDVDLYIRLATLNAPDPITGPAIRAALSERGYSSAILQGGRVSKSEEFPTLAATAGRLLRDANGPRIAALEIEGWDTHSDQAARIQGPLVELDQGLVAMQAALGPAWASTVVFVMTEFGRTVRANGSHGTDHGTGTVAFIAGGAVLGGRVTANWPGLVDTNLLDNRDLQPTTDLRAVSKGLLQQHLHLSNPALAGVFPGSERVAPMPGLIRGA